MSINGIFYDLDTSRIYTLSEVFENETKFKTPPIFVELSSEAEENIQNKFKGGCGNIKLKNFMKTIYEAEKF